MTTGRQAHAPIPPHLALFIDEVGGIVIKNVGVVIRNRRDARSYI